MSVELQQYIAGHRGEADDGVPNILVIGSGTMGSQIGMAAALAGYRTVVQDISGESLAQARAQLAARMEATVARGRLTAVEVQAALDRLSFATDLDGAAAGADFVIEAATERLDVKEAIFARLGQVAPVHAILATNSSTLGSSKVAAATGRPDRVCNMHFFNPALVMKCVEVVRHEGTSQATFAETGDASDRPDP